jgi:hypothetical protein
MKLPWFIAVCQYVFAEYDIGEVFSIGEFRKKYLPAIVIDTGSCSITPGQSLSRVFTTQLRNGGFLASEGLGMYRLISTNITQLDIDGTQRGSMGERLVALVLNDLGIAYDQEKTFDDLRNPDTDRMLRLDFYVVRSERAYAIEFDGRQHYESVEFFGGEEALHERVRLDKIKDRYCKRNDIVVIRLREKIYDKISQVLCYEILQDAEDSGIANLFNEGDDT